MTKIKDLEEIKLIFDKTKVVFDTIDEGIMLESLSKISYSDYNLNFYERVIKVKHKEQSEEYEHLEFSEKVSEVIEERISNLKETYLRCMVAFRFFVDKNGLNRELKEELDELYTNFYGLQDLAKEKRLKLVNYVKR